MESKRARELPPILETVLMNGDCPAFETVIDFSELETRHVEAEAVQNKLADLNTVNYDSDFERFDLETDSKAFTQKQASVYVIVDIEQLEAAETVLQMLNSVYGAGMV